MFDRNHVRKPPRSLLNLFAFRIQRPLVCRQCPPLLGIAQLAWISELTQVLPPIANRAAIHSFSIAVRSRSWLPGRLVCRAKVGAEYLRAMVRPVES